MVHRIDTDSAHGQNARVIGALTAQSSAAGILAGIRRLFAVCSPY